MHGSEIVRNGEKSLASAKFPAEEISATCWERRRERVRFFKMIMIVAVLVTALELGACAKKQETMTTSAGTTGYSK